MPGSAVKQRNEAGTVVLRPARGGDRAALDALSALLQVTERRLRPTRCAPEDLPAAYLAELLSRARRGTGGVIVAADAGRVVGFAAWRLGEDCLEESPRCCVITDLVLARTHRRRGIGRRLIAAVEEKAAAAGAARLRLTALARNRAAHAAYRAAGYRPAFVTFERTLTPR